ncbi:hypothetical protein [Streptomyces sp. R44]|uniref:Uncharacterized protein n=1 Tax=Streptomyces sp. R44 TaxID=3238633 RepID=A0AB39SPT6_9ACTN
MGLPLAVHVAAVGHRPLGYEVDDRRVQQIAVGHLYVEDVTCARVRARTRFARDAVPIVGGTVVPERGFTALVW